MGQNTIILGINDTTKNRLDCLLHSVKIRKSDCMKISGRPESGLTISHQTKKFLHKILGTSMLKLAFS